MDPSGPGPGRVRGRGRVLEVLDPSGPGPLKSWGSAMSSPQRVTSDPLEPDYIYVDLVYMFQATVGLPG